MQHTCRAKPSGGAHAPMTCACAPQIWAEHTELHAAAYELLATSLSLGSTKEVTLTQTLALILPLTLSLTLTLSSTLNLTLTLRRSKKLF